MRISQVSVELSVEDLNASIKEFAPESKVQIVSITPDGVRGQVKLLWWNIDFLAIPKSKDENISIDVTAHMLVPIPSGLVERSLKEATRDAPVGIDVLEQSLRVHLPSVLKPIGISLAVRELRPDFGVLRLTVEDIHLVTKPLQPKLEF